MGVATQRKQPTKPGIRKFLVSSRNSRILALRSVPWGSGRHSARGAHYRPTPSAKTLNTLNHRRWGRRRRQSKRPSRGSLNSRLPVAIPLDSRPAAHRGGSGRHSARRAHYRPTPDAETLNTRRHRIWGDEKRTHGPGGATNIVGV